MRERSRWLTLAMVVGSALALLAFAACGDDDDDSGGTNTATATQAGGDATSTGGATAEPTDSGDNNDPFASLDELTQGLDQATGKVTYEFNTDGDITTLTLYSDPPNSRYDSVDSDGNASTIIYTSDNVYSCDSSSETCFAFPSGDTGGLGGLGFLTGFFGASSVGVYVAAAQAAGLNVDSSSESYAGVDADCFSWTDPTEDTSSVKFCFGPNGVMLYEEIISSDGTTTITATEFSEDVSDSDFEPPYDVTSLTG